MLSNVTKKLAKHLNYNIYKPNYGNINLCIYQNFHTNYNYSLSKKSDGTIITK